MQAEREMPINIDNVLGLHEQAANLRAKRTEVLAGNIANADTPGYKAKDFDFRSALEQAQGDISASRLRVSDARHITDGESLGAELMYRIPHQPSIDGNTVDANIEKTKFTENAIQYQASLAFLDSKIKGLIRAIRGE